MPKVLTTEQVNQYRRDGYLFPLRIMSAEQAADYRRRIEALERAGGGKFTGIHRTKFYLRYRWAWELATNPVMLDAAEAVAHSALHRTESRGSHQRLDHTSRDDEKFLKHSMAMFQGSDQPPRIDYKPVTITKWPPGERTYGADSGLKEQAAGTR